MWSSLEPQHGVFVFLSPLNPEPGDVRVGLDAGAQVEITDNGGAGIFVTDDGSVATIDSRNIEFAGNPEGDTLGNVCDVADGPCP